MEKYLEYSRDILEKLRDLYSNCKFDFQIIKLNLHISVFFIRTESKDLEDNDLWQEIAEEIAIQYQPKLESIYEKWNLYIIYLTSDKIPKELKNKIENNKFSSRKIVEDNYSSSFNTKELNKLIIKHITNSDLKKILELTRDNIKENYKPINTELWKLIHKDSSFARDTELQSKIVEQISLLNHEN